MDTQVEQLAAHAYNALRNEVIGNLPEFKDLPESAKFGWYSAIVQTQIFSEFPGVIEPIASGSHSASCAWEVVGGLIPGKNSDPSITKQWGMTSDEYHGEHSGQIFSWRTMEAVQYAQTLVNPGVRNWVRLDWIRF